MGTIKTILFACIISACHFHSSAQEFTLSSPDKKILFSIINNDILSYEVKFTDRLIIEKSRLGF